MKVIALSVYPSQDLVVLGLPGCKIVLDLETAHSLEQHLARSIVAAQAYARHRSRSLGAAPLPCPCLPRSGRPERQVSWWRRFLLTFWRHP